jgi:NTP pyrophosphatase (non-canonical NTP hydrolase)
VSAYPDVTDAQVSDWHSLRWPEKADDRIVGAKLAEETGEVCGALIKYAEGRRDVLDVLDELGDVAIVLTVLAQRHGFTVDELRARRFAEVSTR